MTKNNTDIRHLTPELVAIREEIIKEMATRDSHRICPYCNRSMAIGEERANKIATENNRALNALVAALYGGLEE